jgi:hypothetical protein
MSAGVLNDRLPDSKPIHRLIHRTRRLLRSSWVATGLGLTIGLLLGALVVLTALDVVAPLRPRIWSILGREISVDGWLRLLALLLIVVPSTWALMVGVVRPLCRRLAPTNVARRIEEHIPGVHNRLVSCIDLERKDAPPTSPVFHRRLLNESLDRIQGFRPRKVLDIGSLRKAVAAAFITTVAFGLIWAAASSRLPRSLARLFMPFADLPPVSDVAYKVDPGNADALREEPIAFAVQVNTEKDPDDLTLELRGAPGSTVYTYELKPDQRDPKTWRCDLEGGSLGEGYKDGFHYRIFGGGTWSKEHSIRLVDRPVITNVETAVYYPAYMASPDRHPTPPQATEVTGPEEGSVEVVVAAQGEVASGDVQLLKPGVHRIPDRAQKERVWFGDKLPLGVTQEGTWNWESVRNRQVHTEAPAFGTHRHSFSGDQVGHVIAPGDVLYAYVMIDPKNPPETILLQWQEGDKWEHGAYWGKNLIPEGKDNSPARRNMGALPQAGHWTRLEVPARQVDLEGKTLRGMSFILHGGRCLWGASGTVQTEEPGVEVVASFPMKPREDGQWVGRFPLVGEGLFRAELRNSAGHPNKPMREIKYKALRDLPPQVSIDRQGTELVLTKPAAVPLTINAYDDYGLEDIILHVREGDTGPYKEQVIHHLDKPERSHTVVHALAEANNLQPGGQLWYWVEATDRKKQSARTRDYVIRIAADPNAADQQLDAFEKTQDPFRDRLVQLMATQKKIQEQIEKVHKEYAPVAEKVQKAMDDAEKARDKADPKHTAPAPPVKLDPELEKKFGELQKELAKLAEQEKANAAVAQQFAQDLAKSVDQASKLDLLPKEVVKQMQATSDAFDRLIAGAMDKMSKDMARDAAPNPPQAPDLSGTKERGERLQKDLESMQARLDALAKARQGLRDKLRDALAELHRKMATEEGKLTARELEELKAFLEKLREQMKELGRAQDDLAKASETGKDLEELKRKQEDLDKEIERLMAQAKKLLDTKKKGDKPEFPDAPYTPDGETVKVPPREEDTDEPLPGKKGDKSKGDKNKGDKNKDDKAKDDDEKEELFMPALGGKKLENDPRFDKKRRPVKKKPMKGDKPDPSEDQRDEMQDRQDNNERSLDNAERSLKSDQETLEEMLRQLSQATKNAQNPKHGQASESDQLADALEQMMRSPAMRQAMEMARRMQQARQMRRQRNQRNQPEPSQTSEGNREGTPPPPAREADLSKLDPETRTIILRMPPRLRDELIQGMNEQGPEAYRAFIQDYFKRLTASSNTEKK